MANHETEILAKVRLTMLLAKNIVNNVAIEHRPKDELPESEERDSIRAVTLQGMLSDPAVRTWLRDQVGALPESLPVAFLETSSILALILAAFDTDGPVHNPLTLFAVDEEAVSIAMTLAQIEERAERDRVDDALATLLTDELRRREIAHRTPFARTVTTLLGSDALLWLTATSQEGSGKLQLHEFSRVNWYRIWEIENQVAIERELIGLSGSVEPLAKAVVALCWTLVALASLVPDAMFLGEYASHLVSQRSRTGSYTMGKGKGSYVLVSFSKPQIVSLIDLLQVAIINPLMSAADLMWIGAAMVQDRSVSVRHVEPARVVHQGFDLFLSHRGRDAKRQLVSYLRGLPESRSVFLDCLTMPHGVVNRDFVFGSLARSKQVIIVNTDNYNSSEWCQKERWFAQALADQNRLNVTYCKVDEVLDVLRKANEGELRYPSDVGHKYPILPRVLTDVDYWARKPNFHSLKESGHPVDALLPIQAALGLTGRPSSQEIGEGVRQTFFNVLASNPDAVPFDLWAAALQYAVAAFGISAQARSKDEVRRGIDQLVAVAQAVTEMGLHLTPTFRENGSAYLSLLAAAVTIQLSGFKRELPMAATISAAVAGAAVLHDGILLLDARPAGEKRDFRLRLVAEMVKANIGSVGIVQDAADEVHQTYVGDLPVEVLPCVTLHSGMNDMFMAEKAASPHD